MTVLRRAWLIVTVVSVTASGCSGRIGAGDTDATSSGPGDGGAGAGLCAPCGTHEECGSPDGYCLRNSVTGETFCGRACSEGACPTGFVCLRLSGAGLEADQCVPANGSCAETPVPCDPACGANERCQAGRCVPAATDGCDPPCAANERCEQGACVLADTGGCTPPCQSGQTCREGVCVAVGPYEAELQLCVDLTNQYRAQTGRPPLRRSAALEAYAAEGAAYDAAHGTPHGHFMATNGGGVAVAENEIPGWDVEFGGGSLRGVVEEGLRAMWDEGPGGGHHDNMNSSAFSELGCGIFVTSRQEVWVVQDFR